MESDFVTRHHIDSVTPFSDPSISDLLLKYRTLPPDPKPIPTFSGVTPPPEVGAVSSNLYISNMLGQLQANMQSMMNRDVPNLSGSGSGLQLNVNSDILRWMIVLIFVIVLVLVIFKYMSYRRAIRNPLKKRLRRLENEMKALRNRKNPASLPDRARADEDESEDDE